MKRHCAGSLHLLDLLDRKTSAADQKIDACRLAADLRSHRLRLRLILRRNHRQRRRRWPACLCSADGFYRYSTSFDSTWRRRLELLHARILRIWGARGTAPDRRRPGQGCDAGLWAEAMERLGWALRSQGIVAGCAQGAAAYARVGAPEAV